jgi:hypothetical protein
MEQTTTAPEVVAPTPLTKDELTPEEKALFETQVKSHPPGVFQDRRFWWELWSEREGQTNPLADAISLLRHVLLRHGVASKGVASHPLSRCSYASLSCSSS